MLLNRKEKSTEQWMAFPKTPPKRLSSIVKSKAWQSVKWRPFKHCGEAYDLSHVHPFNWEIELDGVKYQFTVAFSHHVFTSLPKAYPFDEDLVYTVEGSRDIRCFDFERYELSKRLAEVITNLHARPCFHTGYGNFFTLELLGPKGTTINYEVYFDVIRVGYLNQLRLIVQSAYVREPSREKDQPKLRKIRLSVIAYKKLNKKKIAIQR